MTSFILTGGQRRRKRKQIEESDDEFSDEEEEQLVCNMTGRPWEALPYRIVIDSGVCASVLPSDWCNHVNLINRGSGFLPGCQWQEHL